jgi:hypothetical protein
MVNRLPKREIELGRALYPEAETLERPRTRGECAEGPRPCPFVGCKYHLYLDINSHTGSIKLNFPDLEPEELSESCALDVADRGGTTLYQVGKKMNVTRERARQLEERALGKLDQHRRSLGGLADASIPAEEPMPVLESIPSVKCRRDECGRKRQPNTDPELDGLCGYCQGAARRKRIWDARAVRRSGEEGPGHGTPTMAVEEGEAIAASTDGEKADTVACPAAAPTPAVPPMLVSSTDRATEPGAALQAAAKRTMAEAFEALEILELIGWSAARELAARVRRGEAAGLVVPARSGT